MLAKRKLPIGKRHLIVLLILIILFLLSLGATCTKQVKYVHISYPFFDNDNVPPKVNVWLENTTGRCTMTKKKPAQTAGLVWPVDVDLTKSEKFTQDTVLIHHCWDTFYAQAYGEDEGGVHSLKLSISGNASSPWQKTLSNTKIVTLRYSSSPLIFYPDWRSIKTTFDLRCPSPYNSEKHTPKTTFLEATAQDISGNSTTVKITLHIPLEPGPPPPPPPPPTAFQPKHVPTKQYPNRWQCEIELAQDKCIYTGRDGPSYQYSINSSEYSNIPIHSGELIKIENQTSCNIGLGHWYDDIGRDTNGKICRNNNLTPTATTASNRSKSCSIGLGYRPLEVPCIGGGVKQVTSPWDNESSDILNGWFAYINDPSCCSPPQWHITPTPDPNNPQPDPNKKIKFIIYYSSPSP